MKHKFKRGDLVMMKYELTTYPVIELGVILSFSEINSMYAKVHIIAQLQPHTDHDRPYMRNDVQGMKTTAIRNLAIATTDAIDNYFKRRKAHTFSV